MGNQLFGAMQVIRCQQDDCDWQSPSFRTPLSPERAAEIDELVAVHEQSHAATSEDEAP
jgi:hypothetical protein